MTGGGGDLSVYPLACVGSFTSPGIDRRDQGLLVSHPKDTEINNL